MAERQKVEERIKKKEQEIQVLEDQLRDARVYINALQDVLKLFPRDSGESGNPASLLRAGSLVAQARLAILSHGAPMHVNDLVKAMGRDVTRTTQTALAGSIAAYVRKREVFTRPAPNTFGLIELDARALDAVAEPELDSPPDDFGVDPTPVPTEPGGKEDFDDDIPF